MTRLHPVEDLLIVLGEVRRNLIQPLGYYSPKARQSQTPRTCIQEFHALLRPVGVSPIWLTRLIVIAYISQGKGHEVAVKIMVAPNGTVRCDDEELLVFGPAYSSY